MISDEEQAKETAIPKTHAAQEASRPTAFPTEPVAEAGKASAGADRADNGGGGRRSVAAALNAGVAPTASPESPSPTEQNLPRVLWDRPPGRAATAAAAGGEGPRPPSAPAAGPECSPQPRRTDFVVQRGADSQSEISKFCQQTPAKPLISNSRSSTQVHTESSAFSCSNHGFGRV